MQKGSKVHYLKGICYTGCICTTRHTQKGQQVSTIAAHEYFKKKSSIFGIFYHSSWCFLKFYVIRLDFYGIMVLVLSDSLHAFF